ncbi:hypothetical protein BH11BAC4_BH11BAC4_16720 [soil metagenome]
MNFLHRLLKKQAGTNDGNESFHKVEVCFEASISFATDFLVHFYDAENRPFLLEKSGTYFQLLQKLPLHRSAVYFRVHVFNPACLADQTIKISVKVKQLKVVEKLFEIPHHNTYSQWHSVQASLI